MVSAHDLRCLAGIDTGHLERYYTRWLGQNTDPPNTMTVDYLRVARDGKPPYTNDTTRALGSAVRDRAGAGGLAEAGTYGDVEGPVRPSVINEAIAMDLSCARDHKWRLVSMAIERQECNCLNQVRVLFSNTAVDTAGARCMDHKRNNTCRGTLRITLSVALDALPACNVQFNANDTKIHVIAGVYRLWACTGGDLDDLGIASIHREYNGGRDFWFERRHLSSRTCEFSAPSDDAGGNTGLALNLTFGAIPYDPDVSNNLERLRVPGTT